MKAILCSQYCQPDDLVLTDVPDPVAGPGEAVIAIKAAALNFFDILMIQGKYQIKPPFPFSPAAEVAGVIESVGAGVTEWRDLEAAVAYAHKHGANQFVLGGNSMGGAVVASYLKHAKPTDVLGVVLDAPMLDFEQTLEWGAAQQELPMVGKGLPESLTWVAKRISEARFGLRWAPTDYLRDTSWVREPVLIVHGTKDLTVPLSTSRQLARAERRVRLVEFPGAGHCQSWNFDPKAYDETIAAFVKQVT